MRISRLHIQNFKCFERQVFNLNPQFNLFVGENGSGKSSVLDAVAVAAGSWLLGFSGCDSRHILQREVRSKAFEHESDVSFELQFPTEIKAHGEALGIDISWKRTLNGSGGRTTSRHAHDLVSLAEEAEKDIRSNKDITLPLVSYYGTGRLWQEPRKSGKTGNDDRSRISGYRGGVDSHASAKDLIAWFKRDAWMSFQEKIDESPAARTIKNAVLSCIEDGRNIRFGARTEELMVEINDQGFRPFGSLSDGQRNTLALVGDLAVKAIRLNPHIGERVLLETPGIVIIDELDLHLHPKWQRRIIEDLRRTFPKIQFFAATHSPFLIQTAREGDLFLLGSIANTSYSGRGVEEVARNIMGIEMPEMSPRYQEMIRVAKEYFELLENEPKTSEIEKQQLKIKLDTLTAPYSDNPAYVAFLEMKRGAAGILS